MCQVPLEAAVRPELGHVGRDNSLAASLLGGHFFEFSIVFHFFYYVLCFRFDIDVPVQPSSDGRVHREVGQ